MSTITFDSALQKTVAEKIFGDRATRQTFMEANRLKDVIFNTGRTAVHLKGDRTNTHNARQLFFKICRHIKEEFGTADALTVETCLTFIENPRVKALSTYAAKQDFTQAAPKTGGKNQQQQQQGPAAFAPKTLGQARMLETIEQRQLTFAVGPAGTGKTRVAVHAAVQSLLKGEVKKIFLARPAIPAGKDPGALPGGMDEKLGPYMLPLLDELNEELGPARAKKLRSEGVIEIAPIETMRGRTFKDAFVIVDESQNTTVEQMKMALTRLGKGSRMVVTGDPGQIDLPKIRGERAESGLVDVLKRVESQPNSSRIGITKFTIADCVREDVVKDILDLYEENKTMTQRPAPEQDQQAPRRRASGGPRINGH